MTEKNLQEEIQMAEAIIRKAEQLLKENESKIGDIKPNIDEKISELKKAIEKKDLDLINKATDELQVPIAQLSARVHEPIQEKPADVECDSCTVSFKLPPGLLGPKPKKKKKEEVVDADLEID